MLVPNNFYGIALQSTSPAIDKGDDAACAAAPVNNTSLNGLPRPLGIHCDIGAYEYPQTPISASVTKHSKITEDGYILESSETSSKGGSKNNTSTMLYVGDNAANKQYRAILSFDNLGLPEGAVITSVTLRFKYAGVAGTNPFKTHGKLLADVKTGFFGITSALELADFKALASKGAVLSFTNIKDAEGYYSQSLDPSNFQYINRNGVTQFKLRFTRDDNNDYGADYLKIYSGDSGTEPQLIVQFYYYER